MRRYFTLCIVFVAMGSLFGIERPDKIPGIDPLPMAQGDATGISDEKPADNRPDDGIPNNENTDRPDGDSGFPRVRNLTVTPDARYSNSAKISWEVHPDLSTRLYIVRYSRPISTRELLLDSYNLTPKQLEPEQTTFIDKDIPQGTYYYAIVASHELSKDGRLKLIAGQNYTAVPFIVGRPGPTDSESCTADRDRDYRPEEFQVLDIVAINTEKGVVLNWKKPPVPGVRFHVYRGPDPLDSAERLAKATRLGDAREESPFFEDTSPEDGNQVYYGVSVFDCVNNKEYPLLTLNESYISHTYVRPERKVQFDSFLPGSLMAYLASKDTIRLLWVDPGPAIKDYEVYRSSEPIQDLSALTRAKQIGTVENGANGFTDTGLKPGQYFYALIPRSTSGRKIMELQAGRTFTAFGVSIRGGSFDPDKPNLFETPGDGRIKDLSATVEGDSVIFEWKFGSGVTEEDVQLFLYRSKEPLPDIQAIERTGVFLAEIPTSARRYLDRTGGQRYYYAFVENYPAKKKTNVYHTPKPLGPVTTTEPETTETDTKPGADDRLRQILGKTYAMQKYQDCVDEVRNFLQEKDLPAEVRVKALFYQGQSYYFTGQYNQARDIFTRKDVIDQFGDRALFWYRRILERTE
ncbi:MAG: tetratricopeptide repeat protein [Leptospiraceae bacterium]